MRILPPSDAPMTWALAASAVVHAGIAVALVAGPAGAPSPASRVDAPLRVAIAAPLPRIEPLAALQPASFTLPAFAAPGALTSTLPGTPSPAEHEMPPAAGMQVAEVAVTAQLLLDRNRLGPLLGRQLSEFPVEIDSPVRLDDPIVARLPASAVTDPASEPIVVWAVVGWDGAVVEIELASGDPAMAEPVLQAVRQARFVPARNGLVAHRYPIALEFRLAVGDAVAAVAR